MRIFETADYPPVRIIRWLFTVKVQLPGEGKVVDASARFLADTDESDFEVERQRQEKSPSVYDIYSEEVEGNLSRAFVYIGQKLELEVRKKKAFQCNECGKYYAFKSLLQRHLVVHTGEKPYSCHLCDNCFKYQGVLYNHLRTKHNLNETI
ncbi:hypothetical protein TNCV_1173661 [Trichonephila clavipes]|uniref:C2H2-type domain-containing protein n=1 Tax=Trichonephila clavipes TaxID=2585209 RepID=A0A8X6V8M9_TRICX|nr:hypothetical protein TNCV_1173661 [Trichonephila clavipes]